MERLARRELVERYPGRLTAFQKRMADPRAELAVARFVANVKPAMLRPHWRGNRRDLDQVVRRMLEVAFAAAIAGNYERLNAVVGPDWDHGADLAIEAERCLRRLHDWMSQKGEDIHTDAMLQNTLRLIRTVAGDAPVQETRKVDDQGFLRSFEDTQFLIGRMSAVFRELRDSVTGQNKGEPEKRAFVSVLAEGWDFLFNRKPTNGESSPFGRLIEAAWEDIGGPELTPKHNPRMFADQRRAAVRARKGVDILPDEWLPDWFVGLPLHYLRDPRVIQLWSRKHPW